MVVDYRDETPFDSSNHTLEEIARAIRTKKYGIDTREAMAQSLEKVQEISNSFINFNSNLDKFFNLKVEYVSLVISQNEYVYSDNGKITFKADNRASRSSKLSVSPGERYFLFSKNFWDGKCAILTDDNNNVVDFFPKENDDKSYHLDFLIPENVTGLYINCKNVTTPFLTKLISFEGRESIETILDFRS